MKNDLRDWLEKEGDEDLIIIDHLQMNTEVYADLEIADVYLNFFLQRNKGNFRKAFKDFFYYQVRERLRLQGRKAGRKKSPQDYFEDQIKFISKFMGQLGKREKATWSQFVKYCKPHKPDFEKRTFYRIKKKIKKD